MRGPPREGFGRVEARTGEVGRDAERAGLLGQQLPVVAGRERHDAVVVEVTGDDVEGLGTDRSGRPENHHTARPRASLRPDPGSGPSARTHQIFRYTAR